MSNERMAIRALRAGIVPVSHVAEFSVGLAGLDTVLDTRLTQLQRGEIPSTLVVRGEWGTGKSHCLWYLQHRANDRGVAGSIVSLDARSSPLNYPQYWYGAVAMRVRTRSAVGLRELVTEPSADAARLGDSNLVDVCLKNVMRGPANLVGEESPTWGILLGSDLSWSSYGYLKERALGRIESLGHALHKLGLGGLVLGLDEVETIEQLWSIRSRATAYAVLGTLTGLRYVLLVVAATPRFERLINEDISRGLADAWYTPEPARAFLRSWASKRFDVWIPPEPNRKDGAKLADRILTAYQAAYGSSLSGATLTTAIDEWSKSPARNYRRLMRRLVHECDVERPV